MKPECPKISVVMAVHNLGEFLGSSIESILLQSYQDFEFVIINDGSSDSSSKILSNYARQDPRIRIITQPNSGLTKALNRGIVQAKAEYIARQDADDISLPHRLAKQLRFVETHGCDLISSDFIVFDEKGDLFASRPSKKKLLLLRALTLGNQLAHSTFFFKRRPDLRYDEQFRYSQDFEMWLRAGEANWRTGVVPEILVKIRKHKRNISSRKRRDQSYYGHLAIRKHYKYSWPLIRLARKSLGLLFLIKGLPDAE